MFVTFVGCSYAARHSRHISMSAFIEHLTGKPAAASLLLINLLILWPPASAAPPRRCSCRCTASTW
ncbi:hypothetical protein [Pseudomonas benzenivorans]|uniref:hypothetical protein n=1 Tax=Pseudomonas benzenivorans TaxID=556533 RepID=UPI00351659AA